MIVMGSDYWDFWQTINIQTNAETIMALKYYIDTAIWRDLHENRKDKNKPLGELALKLFRKIRINKEKVL